ncbi:MAG: FKBP-type peptidyl-prolyl cis-trans isomerase [Flavobacteriaceae bacterium]
MKIKNKALLILCLSLTIAACSKDDDNSSTTTIRDRAEQQIADNDSIVQYLETHYYNADGVTDALPNFNSLDDIVITELADGETVPDGHVLLKNAVETKTCVYADTDYTYYILRLNQGSGEDAPTFADNVLVNYEGSLLNTGVVFDSTVNPVMMDLTTLVAGWRKVIPLFNVAGGYTENIDGTVSYTNPGLGVMFIPSGLGYFSASNPGASYAPLIFKFELLQTTQNDHDGDGVPSYLEDLNGDGEFTVDYDETTDTTDDDTDDDGTPDYADSDDDGDGILTIYEDLNNDGDPTNDDSDGDGIPNYLDKDSTQSNQ